MLLASLVVFSRHEFTNWPRVVREGWVYRGAFPVEAADALRGRELPGHMFNYFDWGGYLIWALAPEQKVFCDGRTLNPAAYAEYLQAVASRNFSQGGNPFWWNLVRKYDIGYAVLPLWSQGEPFPLAVELSRDGGWSVLYNDDLAVVFVRKP
jgi:hypothetical protein